MSKPSAKQIEEIGTKYNAFRGTLSDDQKNLLDELAKLVWNSVSDEQAMDLQFLAAFTPAARASLLGYASALVRMIEGHPEMIKYPHSHGPNPS
jgi:hypothetical protein